MTGTAFKGSLGLVLLAAVTALAHEKPLAGTAVSAQPGFNTLNLSLVGQCAPEQLGAESLRTAVGDPVLTADFALAGDYAYLGSFANALHVIDISDPAEMRPVARVPMPGPAVDVKLYGNLAAVGVQIRGPSSFGIVFLDISDPTDPQILSQYSETGWKGVHNLFLYRDRAYLVHVKSKGVKILDIADPTQPVLSGSWQSTDGFTNAFHDIFIRDGKAFISDIGSGLAILDLSDPDRPAPLSYVPIDEGLHSAWLEGDYVYCNQEYGGWHRSLHIIDVSDLRNPVKRAQFAARPPPFIEGLGPHNPHARGDRLYWAYYDAGVRIFDLSRPTRPVEIAYYPTPLAWSAQPHDDGLVYVADSRDGLVVLRFQEPAFVIRDVELSASFAATDVAPIIALSAAIARSPHHNDGEIHHVTARFFERSDAEGWPLVGREIGAGFAYSGRLPVPADLPNGRYQVRVEVEDDHGAVYPFQVPFDIVPAADMQIFTDAMAAPWQAKVLHSEMSLDLREEVVVHRGRLAQALVSDGFHVAYSPAAPINPEGYAALAFAIHPGDADNQRWPAFNISVNDRMVWLLRDQVPGVDLDIDRPEWQEVEIPLDIFKIKGPIHQIRFWGNLRGTFYLDDLRLKTSLPARVETAVAEDRALPAAVADADLGFALEQNFPNPFNSATTIAFALPAAGPVQLDIYSLSGQKVSAIAAGSYPAGRHAVQWDGRDEHGLGLASGIYFCRLRIATDQQTRKLLLLR